MSRLSDILDRLIDKVNKSVKVKETAIPGWVEIATDIRNSDENIVLSSPIDIDNLKLRIASSNGEEDIITNDSKGLTISKKSDGSYVMVFVSGVNSGTAVYEFRLKGMVDGSGDTLIPWVDMVSPDATLSVYQWSDTANITREIDEDLIPENIARKDDIPQIPEINYPVTSVNGQTGDVVISNKAIYDAMYPLVSCHTPELPENYISDEVYRSGVDYIVLWNDIEYVGKTIDPNGKDHYDPSCSSLFLYDKQGNYVTGNIWCDYDTDTSKIVCAHYFLAECYTDTVFVYDPTKTVGVKSWNELEDKPFYYTSTVLFTDTNVWMEKMVDCEPLPLSDVDSCIVTIDGVDYVSSVTNYENVNEVSYTIYVPGFGTIHGEPIGGIDGHCLYFFLGDNRSVTIRKVSIICIEEKYIPDSIARKSDIKVSSVNGKTGQVLLSYDDLKDKPFGEDIEITYVSSPFVGVSDAYIDVVLEDGEYTLVVETNAPFQYNDTNTFALIVQNGFAQIDHIGPGCSDDELLIYRDGQIYHTLGECGYSGCITIYSHWKSQLPEEYIPDTIARVSDLQTMLLNDSDTSELLSELDGYIEEETTNE